MGKDNRIVTFALHETGKNGYGTMQSDYAVDHKFIKIFEYQPEQLKETLRNAAVWAEEFIYERSEHYRSELEKLRYR
jgi:hypothetical protein